MRKSILVALGMAFVVLSHPIQAIPRQTEDANRIVEVKTEKIPFEVKYVFNRDLTPGRVKKVTDGKDGVKTITITKHLVEGEVVKTDREESIQKPTDAVFHMGRAGFQGTDRGSFTRAKVVTMESTAYLPSDGNGKGITASGLRAGFGVVATDPKVIPLGTLVFVEGYGFAVAADTGGAIKGNKIDVCITDRKAALRWGRRKVKVHIFQDRHTKGMRLRGR